MLCTGYKNQLLKQDHGAYAAFRILFPVLPFVVNFFREGGATAKVMGALKIGFVSLGVWQCSLILMEICQLDYELSSMQSVAQEKGPRGEKVLSCVQQEYAQ